MLVLPSCAGAAEVPAGLVPPNKPPEAGAVVVPAAVAVVAGAVVAAVVVEGAVVEAALANKVLEAAGAAELLAGAVVAGFAPNRPPAAGVEVAGAVVAEAVPPNKLGVAVADEDAGAVVVAAAGVEVAGAAVEAVVVVPAAPPNNDFAPLAGAAVVGVLVPVVAAAV